MSLLVDVSKDYGKFQLNVHFEHNQGILGMLGASGSGKSLTLKLISGILTPDRGKIILDNRVLYDSERKINLLPKKRKVGYLFQNYALFPNMTRVRKKTFSVGSLGKRIKNQEIQSVMLKNCG